MIPVYQAQTWASQWRERSRPGHQADTLQKGNGKTLFLEEIIELKANAWELTSDHRKSRETNGGPDQPTGGSGCGTTSATEDEADKHLNRPTRAQAGTHSGEKIVGLVSLCQWKDFWCHKSQFEEAFGGNTGDVNIII